MGQFDAVIRFNTAALAKADGDVLKYYDVLADLFAADSIVQVQVWRNSQDTLDVDGNPVHNFMSGFFLLISLPRLVLALRDNAAIQVVFDRDKCNARRVGGVVKSNVSNAILQDIRISPVFAGMDLPFGAFT